MKKNFINMTKWLSLGVLIFLSIILNITYAYGNNLTTAFVNSILEKSSSISSYKAKFTSVHNPGKGPVFKGIVICDESGKFYKKAVEDKKEFITIFDGKYFWEIYRNLAYKRNIKILSEKFGEDFMKSELPLDLRNPFFNIKNRNLDYKGTKYLNLPKGEEILTYLFSAKKNILKDKEKFVEKDVKLWIDTESKLLRKYVVYNNDGSVFNKQFFYSIEINPDIKKNLFSPPILDKIKIVNDTQKWVGIYSKVKKDK